MGPSYAPVICDSSSKTRGLRVASGHRLVPFEPFFIWCMHKRARLRGSPGHIRARIRSSNCTFTTTSTSIYEHLIIKSSHLIIQSSYLIIQSSYVIIESSYLIIESSYLIIQSSYQFCVIIKKLSILNNNIWLHVDITFWIFMHLK